MPLVNTGGGICRPTLNTDADTVVTAIALSVLLYRQAKKVLIILLFLQENYYLANTYLDLCVCEMIIGWCLTPSLTFEDLLNRGFYMSGHLI